MSSYLLAALLAPMLVILLVVNKRQKQAQSSKATKPAVANTASSGKKAAKPNKASTQTALPTDSRDNEAVADDVNWDNHTQGTTVSVETVDALTEYKVYKQFGYHQKAAESLALYLHGNQLSQAAQNTLAVELGALWLQAKQPDLLAEMVDEYRTVLNQDDMAQLIRDGLALEPNHLPLRVLAEELLGWNVQQTTQELGLQQDDVLDVSDNQPHAESLSAQPARRRADQDASERRALVRGEVGSWQIDQDERDVLLGFAQPEKGYRLLKDQLVYDAAIRCLNKAIQQADKPASLIIDALSLDYRNNKVSVFAQHLWRLYYSLGQYGSRVKERMLGWGYNLGQHAMFDELESRPGEQRLREIGLAQGYITLGRSAVKAKRRTLVENTPNEDFVAENAAERILRDAESLLTYGQLEHAMALLETSILAHPQESQLYIALFDLYERAEDWPRLEKMLHQIRDQIKTPPEEVVLAMSQLLQRIHQDGGAH